MATANTIFQNIAANKPTNIKPTDVIAAREWFRQQAQKITDHLDPRKLFGRDGKSMTNDINITSVGSMFSFYYDPKTKDKLPYYDIFPLIFVIEVYRDGFLGINLHYLPPFYRAKLMDALYNITTKQGDMVKLQVSYRILKSAAKFKWFKPCVKRYLSGHVRSRFFFIEPGKWDMVMMLPTQKFIKQSEEVIWRESTRIGR